MIQAEIVLKRNRRECLALALDLHALLRLNRLMEPFGVAATFHEASRELINEFDAVVADDVVAVTMEQDLCMKSDMDGKFTGDITVYPMLNGYDAAGKEKLKIPKGIQSGELLTIKGAGIPYINGKGRGNEILQVIVNTPKNLSKRQVKAPKIYIRDSGILHSLLNLSPQDWFLNPKIGASWEGYALEEVLRSLNIKENACYFWATEKGAELDLLVFKNGQRLGFEFKHSDSPKVTRSMYIAMEDLKLETITIVVPGNDTYQLTEKIFVKGLHPFVRQNYKLQLN